MQYANKNIDGNSSDGSTSSDYEVNKYERKYRRQSWGQ